MSVIFPSACYLKMFEDELDEGEMAINWIIMFVGGFCVVAGSVSALEQIKCGVLIVRYARYVHLDTRH